MREKIIRGLISSIIVVLLLGFEYKLSFNIVHDFESRNTSYEVEDFYQINDYEVDGDKLVPTSTDPQLILNFDGSVVDKVSVFLSEAPTDEIKGQLYFFEKKGFAEDSSIQISLAANQTEQSWSMDKRNIGFLRLDIDGEISIDHIEVVSEIAHMNMIKLAGFGLVCLLIDLLVWILVYRKIYAISKKAGECFNRCDRFIEGLGRKLKINISVFFAVSAMVLGVVYSFIIPMGMVPDEPIHVAYMSDAFGVTGISEQYYNLLEQGQLLDEVRDQKSDVDKALYSDISKVKFDKELVSFTFDIKIHSMWNRLLAWLSFEPARCLGYAAWRNICIIVFCNHRLYNT